MAKRAKGTAAAIPPAMRRPLFAAAALVAAVIGLMLVWQGYQGWRQGRVAPELVTLRESLATDLARDIGTLRTRMGTVAEDSYLRADLSAGAREDALARVREGWPMRSRPTSSNSVSPSWH